MQTQGSEGSSDLEGWDPRVDAFSNKQFNSYTKGLGKDYSSREQGDDKEVKLFVKGIPNELSTEGLKNLFLEHGDVLSVKKCNSIFPEQGHTFGFVSYKTTREALAAVQKLDGFQITKKFHLRVRPAISDEERRKQKEERQEEEDFLNSLPGQHDQLNCTPGSDDSSKENKVCGTGVEDLATQSHSTKDPGTFVTTKPVTKTTVLTDHNIEPKSDRNVISKPTKKKHRVSVIERLAASALQCEQQPLSVNVPTLTDVMDRKPGVSGPAEARGLGRGLLAVKSSQLASHSPRIPSGMVGSFPGLGEGNDDIAGHPPSYQQCESLKITVDCGKGARLVQPTPEKVLVPSLAKHSVLSPGGRGRSFYDNFSDGDDLSPAGNFSSRGLGRGQYVPRNLQANKPKMQVSPRGCSPSNQTRGFSHGTAGQGHLQRPRDYETANQSISSRHSDSGSTSSDKARKSQCKFCGKPGKSKCTVCKTPYCGQQCQREHWKTHKFECKLTSTTVSDSNETLKEEDLCQGFQVSVDDDFVKAFQKQFSNIPADQFPPMPLASVSPFTSTSQSSPVGEQQNIPVAGSLGSQVTQNTPVASIVGSQVPQNTPVAGGVGTRVIQNTRVVDSVVPQIAPIAGKVGEPVQQTTPTTIAMGQLAMNTPIQGFVSWSTSPTDLRVCSVADMEKYDQLTQQITESYSKEGEDLSCSPSKGDYCAAFYVTFSTWNRGLVQHVDNTNATVLFIDYGNSEVLATKFIRKLLPQFFSLPAQANLCSLKGFTENPALKWSEKSCHLMKEVISESTPYMLKAVQCIEGVSIIELFNMDSPEGPSLNEQLKSAGCPASEMPEKRLLLTDSLPTVCDEVKEGDSVSIAVCHANNPWDFRVHLCDQQHVEKFQKFNQELNTFYDTQPSEPYQCTTFGELVVARFSADNTWYRAEVLQINKTQVELLFVDFGNIERSPIQNIRAAGTKCQSLPLQAVNCGLDAIMPVSGIQWPDEVIQLIQNLPSNLTAKVKSKTGQKLNLEIYENENSTLSSYIVKQGLAKFSQAAGSSQQSQPQGSGSSENIRPLASPAQTLSGQPSLKSQTDNFLSTKLKMGCSTFTLCPVVNDDGTFYLQRVDEENQAALEKIVTIDEVYQSRKLVPFQPKLNQKVCAQFTGSWSRGCVLDILTDGMIKVFFVDYGNSAVLPSNLVQPLDDSFTDIPAQGIKCRLNGVNWSPGMTPKLKDMICEKAPTVTLIREHNGCSFVDTVLDDVNVNSIILAHSKSNFEKQISPPLKPTAPQKIADVSLKLGSPTPGQCTVVTEDGTFFVQIISDTNISNLEKLDQINAAYQGKSFKPTLLEKGHTVCAKYKNYWCRGTVEDILSDGSVKVFFVDYGNTETLPSTFVQPLEGFLDIPAQGIKCKLNGCENVPWSKDTNSKLNDLIFERALTVTLQAELNGYSSVNVEVEGTSVNAAILASLVSKVTQPVVPSVTVVEKKIVPVSLRKGQLSPAQCLAVTENGTFYVQIMNQENIPNLLKLNDIHTAYHGRSCVPAVFKKSQHVCAEYKDYWCRGTVEDILSNGSVKVFFLDYGNTETIPSNLVQPLDEKFMDIPAQGIKCVLNGSEKISWSSEITDKLKQLIFETVTNLTLVKELNGCSFVNVEVNGHDVNTAVLGSHASKIAPGVTPAATSPMVKSVGTMNTNMPLSLQSTEALPCLQLTAGKPLPVSCVLVEPDGSFFVQDISDSNRETLLTLFKMDEIYQERPITMLVPFKPVRGQLACAQFLDSWCRARIRSVQAVGSVEVFFVDYGNVEVVPSKSVQDLDDEYLNIPVQAIRCVLDGYETIHWLPPLVQKLSDLILNQTAVVSLVREVDGCNFVKLHLEEKGVNVNATLLAECQKSEIEPSKVPQSQTTTRMGTLKELGIPSLPGKEADLVLMTIVSPVEFFCVQANAEAITQSIHDSCAKLPYDRSYSPAINELCCARFVLDKRWYRAVVIDKEESSGQYEVLYIDYGNEAILEHHDVRRPPQPFSQPPCALRCFIPGVTCGPDDRWSPQSIEIIQGCSEQLVHIEILRVVDGRHEVKLLLSGEDVGEKLRRSSDGVKTTTPTAGGDAASTRRAQDSEMSQAESLRQQNEELRRQLMQLQALVAQQAANKG